MMRRAEASCHLRTPVRNQNIVISVAVNISTKQSHHRVATASDDTYTMMLLMGIWISFTKKPMNPIIANPIAVATAILWNSETKIDER
jgi:hypothetical protein